MFISRKRYEAELEKARREGAEKVYQDQSMDRHFTEVHQRIDQIARRLEEIDPRNNICEGRCPHC